MLEIYQEILNAITKGETVVVATVISSQGSTPRRTGTKMLIRKDRTLVGTIGGGFVESQVIERANEVMKSGKSEIMHFDLSATGKEALMICGGQMDVFLELVLPRETLYLFGAGHISQSVARIAPMLEFRVVVIDPRPENNNAERFPDAESLIVDEYANVFPKLNIDENSFLVICTQKHALDEQCLDFAVGTRAGYIGMIGSKKKVKEIRERLYQKGVSQQQLDMAHAPIGLPIGAETPQEIALSVLAEIIKVRRNSYGRGAQLGDLLNIRATE